MFYRALPLSFVRGEKQNEGVQLNFRELGITDFDMLTCERTMSGLPDIGLCEATVNLNMNLNP